MAMAYVVDPKLCPVTEFHITIDEKGFTRPTPGAPNASACLESDSEKFFHFLLPQLMAREKRGTFWGGELPAIPCMRGKNGQSNSDPFREDVNANSFETKRLR
jgi:hypothetical protein